MSYAKHAIRVTDLGEFVRHKSCQRRFKLGYDDQALFKEISTITGAPFATIDPVLAEHGKAREEDWARDLVLDGFLELDLPEEEEGKGAPWEDFASLANQQAEGQDFFAREVQIIGIVGAFKLFGRIDFTLVRWKDGVPHLQIVECKASRKDRTYQRMQVVVYLMMLRQILAQDPLVIAGHTLDPAHIQINVVRIDEGSNAMVALKDLPTIEGARNLEEDISQLLAEDGLLDRILAAEIDDLPFQLEGKCDDCQFNIHCLSESSRQRRLELLGIAPDMVRALFDADIETLDDLADMDPSSSAAEELRRNPDFVIDVESLLVRARTRRVMLPAIEDDSSDDVDEEPLEEEASEVEESDRAYEVTPIPNSGYGQLPEHENYDPEVARGKTWKQLSEAGTPKHRLMRVFLNVNYDYVEDRIGAIAAHVTASAGELHTPMMETEDGEGWEPDPRVLERFDDDGEEPRFEPLSGETIVEIKRGDWSGNYTADCATEQALLRSFFGKLVEQIQLLAPADNVPLHFYVWSSNEITRLIEACNRTGGRMLRYLRELFGCRESLEQLIYSDLSRELNSRYAFAWTGRGLSVVTSLRWFGRRYHWRRKVGRHVVNLDEELSRDLFDFRSRLYINELGEWVKRDDPHGRGVMTEVRARFYDNLSAPYWRAFWGTLPDPDDKTTTVSPLLVRPLRDYNRAGRAGILEAYLGARVHAMRWLEERVKLKNRGIRKPLVEIDALPNFQLDTHSPAEAAVDYLRLDQHVKFNDWLQTHLTPPYVRVASGISLPIKDIQVTSGDGKKLLAKLDLTPCYLDAQTMRARSSIDEGKMVRLHPRDGDPRIGQSTTELIWRGSTAVIKSLDWDREEIELDIIPSGKYSNEYYTLKSSRYDRNAPPDFATLDASITNFVDARVEKRLMPARGESTIYGDHMQGWFDPENPSIPEMQPLPADRLELLESVLRALRLPGGFPLLERRVRIILEGLGTRIQLVQGPPGTGKTMVAAVAILLRIFARRKAGDVVIVTAHTHTAVDTLLARIAKMQDAFDQALASCGQEPLPVALVKLHSSEVKEESGDGIGDFKASGEYSKIKAYGEGKVLVLGGTTSGVLKLVEDFSKKADYKSLPDRFQTPFLVIDEASMMVCAHLLALATCVAEDGEMLLAGDHRQLAPIRAHDWDNEDRPPAQLYRMHESAFDAIVRMRYPAQAGSQVQRRVLTDASIRRDGLETTYRLPATIRRLIQPLYDRDDLVLRGPDGEISEVTIEDGAGLRAAWCSSHSLYLLAHREEASRQSNEYEAYLIKHLLDAGIDSGEIREKSVAVITPHRAQRAMLKTLLEDYEPYVEMIDTVERLQGGEADTIFFSATVSDPVAIGQETEFILDIERANVAFSRTKRRLVVLASRALLDFVPPRLEHYQTALLWKHLRAMCARELAAGEIAATPYSILVP